MIDVNSARFTATTYAIQSQADAGKTLNEALPILAALVGTDGGRSILRGTAGDLNHVNALEDVSFELYWSLTKIAEDRGAELLSELIDEQNLLSVTVLHDDQGAPYFDMLSDGLHCSIRDVFTVELWIENAQAA